MKLSDIPIEKKRQNGMNETVFIWLCEAVYVCYVNDFEVEYIYIYVIYAFIYLCGKATHLVQEHVFRSEPNLKIVECLNLSIHLLIVF